MRFIEYYLYIIYMNMSIWIRMHEYENMDTHAYKIIII